MPFLVKHLGLADYVATYEAMRTFTKQRDANTPDEVWVLQHPPVFTLGLAGDASHLHSPSQQIPLIQVDRGGEITYHGPGQIVVYLLLDLKRLKLFVKELVSHIEQAVIDTLGDYGLQAQRLKGAPGIYITNQPGVAEEPGRNPAADTRERRKSRSPRSVGLPPSDRSRNLRPARRSPSAPGRTGTSARAPLAPPASARE